VGVTRVFYGKDFISVTKKEEEDWKILKPEVLSVITEHYTRGQPLLLEDVVEPEDTKITEADSESVAMIKEIIQTRVRPFVQEDGGDLRFVSFDIVSGLVLVEMKGSCAGCPSSAVTLKNGIENMLRHYVDEVKEVKAIDA
jgi:Fe-S cluster biogenesis protein NfuA